MRTDKEWNSLPASVFPENYNLGVFKRSVNRFLIGTRARYTVDRIVDYHQSVILLNSCAKQTTCHRCITDTSVCVWCASNDYNGTRCKPQSTHNENWCPDNLQNPESKAKEKVNRPFSADVGNVTQLKPQNYHMKLRPGEPLNFTFSFQAAKDYPVDLYFLIDKSRTMGKVLNDTAKQSENIYRTLKNLTNDVYLGMGSFMDKNAIPFVKYVNDHNVYSYKHHLKLTSHFEEFRTAIESVKPETNRDAPEGGFDALAQAIVCKEEVGWRNESRKIVAFLTDSQFHTAGDGRSAGIFQPYDGKCYTVNGNYSKELEMDYPSVSIINKLAIENDVIVLFAVHDQVEGIYQSLVKAISSSKLAILKQGKQGDIVKILKNIYEEITTTIKLKVHMKTGRQKNYEITFDPDCRRNGLSDCNVANGKQHNFSGTIKLTEYDGRNDALAYITVEGMSEKLTLNITVINDCDCALKEEKNSSFCHGEIRQCGICKCSSKRYGEGCACVRNENNSVNDTSTCIAEGVDKICSGHGKCTCGACECDHRYEGKYCECSKDSCPRNGTACNGHGRCECGTCKCSEEWSGDACQCPKSGDGCKDNRHRVCSNRGSCECGSCKCNAIAPWDKRQSYNSTCAVEPCPTCHNSQCQHSKLCVISHLEERENSPCKGIQIKTFDTIPIEYLNNTDWHLCANIRVGVGCYTKFVYTYDDENYGIILVTQKERDCAENYYMHGGILLLTLLVIGILTVLAWKLSTEWRDRKEWLRFVEQHKSELSGTCENPIYEPAVVEFSNPTFRKRSVNRY